MDVVSYHMSILDIYCIIGGHIQSICLFYN